MKSRYILGALLALLLVAAVVYFYGGGQVPPGQPPRRKLNAQTVADIRNEFNNAKDDVRVLLLLSPT